MSTENRDVDIPVTRLDRFLAFASLTLIVAAVLCFVAMIIGSTQTLDFSTPLWKTVTGIMYFGLPLGVLLFFTLLISNMVRRSRATKADRQRRGH